MRELCYSRLRGGVIWTCKQAEKQTDRQAERQRDRVINLPARPTLGANSRGYYSPSPVAVAVA